MFSRTTAANSRIKAKAIANAGIRRKVWKATMAHPIPDSPDTLLRRKATAEALTASGFPCSDKTLSTKASRGGGPPFRLFGRVPLYRWGDVVQWAEAKLTPPRRSTSEADAPRAS
jgi:hypothetical protein